MRAFIGFKIPENQEINEKLKILEKHGEVKTVEKENLHLCLKFLGDIEEQDVEKIKKAMNVLKGGFEVKLRGTSAFPNNDFIKVIKIDVISEKIKPIQETLENELEKFGFAKEKREFSPHLTLARVKAKPDDSLKKIFDDKDYGEFKVSKIELIKSELSPKGPIYKTVYVKEL